MKKQPVETKSAPAAIGPYSQACVAGDFVYTSGQIPIDPATGAMAASTIEAQTAQAIMNLENVLKAAGSGLEHALKTTVFLTDMGNFAKMNEIYMSKFPAPYPSRSCVEVSRLPKDALVEIEAVAFIP